MFFPRLRRHAKWMFLFLAIVFALGFVGFGVGAGGVGFGDIIRNAAGGSGTPSVSDAEKRVLDNPKDAQAFKDLSTAQQAAGNTDGAIEALQSYTQLRPKNTDALRELAALYLQQASAAQERAQILEARSAYLAPGTIRDTIIKWGRPINGGNDFFVEIPTQRKLDVLKQIYEQFGRIDANQQWVDIRLDNPTYPSAVVKGQ